MFQEDGKLRFIEGVETEGTSVHDGSYEAGFCSTSGHGFGHRHVGAEDGIINDF